MCIFDFTVKEIFIVLGLKTIDVFVGESATFSCQLSGRAPGKVQWWLDGTLLKNSPLSEIGLSQGHIYTLTLKNLAPDDSGTVMFKSGNLSSTAKLLVKGTMFWKITTKKKIKISSIWVCLKPCNISTFTLRKLIALHYKLNFNLCKRDI